MSNFFERLPHEQAIQLEKLARLAFELRENRKLILRKYGVTEEAALHAQIVSGALAEHTGYEDYLSAKILKQTKEDVREALKTHMERDTMSLHLDLKEKIEARFGKQLENHVLLNQDALLATFEGGLAVELRYANPDEYCIAWTWGEALFRIDTAPIHPGLATFPNHFHTGDGGVLPDTLTVPGRAPWENVCGVLEAILEEREITRA